MNHSAAYLLAVKIIVVLALQMLVSCLYEPTGIYENPVDKNIGTPEITSVDLDIDADTLWVYGNQNMTYHFKSSPVAQKILGLKTYIDGVLCDSVLSDSGNFSISESALSEGKHTISIVLFIKSGTGSLADRLNAEFIILKKDWVLMANYSKRNVTYTIENGYLVLHWDKYKNKDLSSYYIQSTGSTINNYYVDSLYYGYKKTYYISLVKKNSDIIDWGTLDIEQNISKPEFTISANNTYSIRWKKSPYYNAVKYRYEYHNYDDNSPSYGSYGFKTGNDTIFTGGINFSQRYSFSLHTLHKKVPESTGDYLMYPQNNLSGYAGEPVNIMAYTSFTSADTLTAFDTKNVYKYYIDGKIIYNEPVNQGSTYGLGHMQISPRGNFLLGKYYDISGTGMRFFAKNLTTGTINHLNFIDPVYSTFLNNYELNISDNGLGIFRLNTKVFVYDVLTNTETASKTFTALTECGSSYKLAPDGKHFMTLISSETMAVDVYKIYPPGIEKLYSLESGISSYQFNPMDANMIIVVKNKTISFIRCEPYSLLRNINLGTDEVFMNIDYFNNEILSINANQFIIRNMNTGEITKTISRGYQQYYQYEKFTLHNHRIIKNKVMLKIQ